MTAPDDTISSNVRTLFPGYFAMVMATGIIAIGAAQQDLDLLADALYVVAAATHLVLAVLLVGAASSWRRSCCWPTSRSHAKGFAFLTTVAATNVLGSASGVVHGWWDLATFMWWSSLVLWAIFVYATLISVVIKGPKPGLDHGINGTWFLLTVATESIVVLGALLLAATRATCSLRAPHRRVLARARAVPDRDDDGVPPVDVLRARSP